jgi:hypothetical protein
LRRRSPGSHDLRHFCQKFFFVQFDIFDIQVFEIEFDAAEFVVTRESAHVIFRIPSCSRLRMHLKLVNGRKKVKIAKNSQFGQKKSIILKIARNSKNIRIGKNSRK